MESSPLPSSGLPDWAGRFIAGVLLWGLPLVLLALVMKPAVAYLAFVAIGIGNAIEDVGALRCSPGC